MTFKYINSLKHACISNMLFFDIKSIISRIQQSNPIMLFKNISISKHSMVLWLFGYLVYPCITIRSIINIGIFDFLGVI